MSGWPEAVNEWIEVAQQALDREGADWDHSREMAEAVAVKLWNYVSEGLIQAPLPSMRSKRIEEAAQALVDSWYSGDEGWFYLELRDALTAK